MCLILAIRQPLLAIALIGLISAMTYGQSPRQDQMDFVKTALERLQQRMSDEKAKAQADLQAATAEGVQARRRLEAAIGQRAAEEQRMADLDALERIAPNGPAKGAVWATDYVNKERVVATGRSSEAKRAEESARETVQSKEAEEARAQERLRLVLQQNASATAALSFTTRSWQKNPDAKLFHDTARTITLEATLLNVTSAVTVSTLKNNVSNDGATIKYKLWESDNAFAANGPTTTKLELTIGYYNIWAERNGTATSKTDDVFRILKEKEEVKLNELK